MYITRFFLYLSISIQVFATSLINFFIIQLNFIRRVVFKFLKPDGPNITKFSSKVLMGHGQYGMGFGDGKAPRNLPVKENCRVLEWPCFDKKDALHLNTAGASRGNVLGEHGLPGP